ncbi:MAG: sugar phosphate isomerase/epimerase [Planctomycetota bacterium]|nr:MAG: sugar phosphate isomerase/epimerase [Planctomycetota bacterium]MCQ3922218.1 sugar phosphate isomerase/epimerase [Planctomycetota bacterium]
MFLGYNTNGLPHHRLEDALTLIAEAGFRGVALTLDHQHLDPTERSACLREARRIRHLLDRHDLRVTVETGARFILDPRRKHQPTLVSAQEAGRARRREFLETCVLAAAELGAETVSLWSGAADDGAGEDEAFMRLTNELHRLLDFAEKAGRRLAFEPEPGMLVDTMARYDRLIMTMQHPLLGLTLDVNHVYALRDGSVREHVERWRGLLWNVHLSDARWGTHEHLPPGDGEVDFVNIRRSLEAIRYLGPVHLELSRHGHDAARVMGNAHAFLLARGYPA